MFNRKTNTLNDAKEAGFVYLPPISCQVEQREVERAAARLFSTDDGQRVLSYLQTVTFCRALGADSADAQLRYMEGQRALVAAILRLIDRGRQ